MKMNLLIICLPTVFLFLVPAFSIAQEIDYKGLPEWSWHKEDSTEYFLYTPKNLQPGKKYPVVLAMHGCCGEDYHATLRNTVDPIVRMWHQFGENKQNVPTYIIAPKTSRGWKQHLRNLKKVMDELITKKQGDPQRIYVTGFSMGGEGTYLIIQAYPGYFAAAIPMGMGFTGDSTRVKDIPIWANQGETDWWSRNMKANVAGIRHLNSFIADTGATWVTGVNPRYSSFMGVGHGVQWIAASTQDLTGWAYSKINDGNIYPVVFFSEAPNGQYLPAGTPLKLNIHAMDPDGTISLVDVFMNGEKIAYLKTPPFQVTIEPLPGDNHIMARATDTKGKSSEAEILIPVIEKTVLAMQKMSPVPAGNYVDMRFHAKGNAKLFYSLVDSVSFPAGMLLYPDGIFRGIVTQAGNYSVHLKVKSNHGDSAIQNYPFTIDKKSDDRILVTGIKTIEGKTYRLGRMEAGISPWFDSRDSVLSSELPEVNFNNPQSYAGLTFIQTDIQDANKNSDSFLSFTIDKDALIYVAYEKLDSQFHSTHPAWLNAFTKEKEEITAQYRYFDVYSKKFPKGEVILPGADAKTNKVGGNYFILIKKPS